MTYSRNEEKANITLEKCNNSNLFDYMMGGKKDISVMEINAMKREQMMMNKFGNFVTDSEASKKIPTGLNSLIKVIFTCLFSLLIKIM